MIKGGVSTFYFRPVVVAFWYFCPMKMSVNAWFIIWLIAIFVRVGFQPTCSVRIDFSDSGYEFFREF